MPNAEFLDVLDSVSMVCVELAFPPTVVRQCP